MYVNGTTVTAESRDALIQNTIVQPSGVNICPLMPFKVVSGINTTQVVRVDPRTDMATSPEPSRAAFAYSTKPFSSILSIARKQLSRTTIELSTIMPTPRTRALIVMTFKENPTRVIRIRDTRMEVGIELPTIRDALKSPKNRKMMIMEITTAITMVSATSFKESWMESASSLATVMVRSSVICRQKFTTAESI